eukprot:TRINITY_DN79238_c0_g1_i1.p1 TRINITY_DN79238_c0_g1~~TRINITY_DN79238_c0_g1_i1.p1  ORF type:complete len:224 (+),score=24.71 TRINITY_DN79238_c0_g1_i1:28-699(+)
MPTTVPSVDPHSAMLGCPRILAWLDREEHESGCSYSQAHCPVLSCSQQFFISEAMQHLSVQHNIGKDSAILRLHAGSMSFRSSISTATYLNGCRDQQNWWWGPQFVIYENIPFFFIISRRVENPDSRGHFYFWVCIGSNQKESKRFLYNLTVEGVQGEKVTYTSTPVSLEMSAQNVREEQRCLLLADSAVKRMLTKTDEKLLYRIEIVDKTECKSSASSTSSL